MYSSREIDEKETIPYPICSVVASGIWYCFFFCVLAPEEMNAIVFGKEMGKGTEGCGLF